MQEIWLRREVRMAAIAAGVVLLLLVLGGGWYVWSINQQYDRARNQAEVVRSRVTTEDGAPQLDQLPQLTQDLIQLEDDLKELDRRVDRPIIGGIARNAPFVGGQVRTSEKLLDLGIELTSLSLDTSRIVNEIRDAFEANGFMGDEPANGPTWLDVFLAHEDEIYELERRYDAALVARAEIDTSGLPGRALNTLNTVDNLLQRGTEIRDEYFRLFPMLGTAFGADDDARYLILLQNSQELRGAGGFVGTYGMMTVSHGRITELEINPIGVLNRAYEDARSEILPAPAPIREYLGQQEWFPHDANWSADFPRVAGEIHDMYTDTGWPRLQGIIAVNDGAVQNVLEIIGPYDLLVEGTVEEVTPEGFIDLIQSYRSGDEAHKEFVGVLGSSVIDQVIEADFDTKKEIFWAMRDSASQREIQVAMIDPAMQDEVARRGWDGKLVPDPEIPTLAFSISNITGNKASQKIWAEAYMDAEHHGDTLRFSWSLGLTHLGDPDGNLDFHGFHRTWLHVYLPEQATLLDTSLEQEPANMVEDSRAMGFHIEILPGEQQWLEMTFELPATEAGLLLRRQAGLQNIDYYVRGELTPGCSVDQGVRLDHDYLVDFEGCVVKIFGE